MSLNSLENYDASTPTQELENFVDALSKWYVRRSRRRFWKTEADDEKKAAYATLYECLKTIILLMAPITPHVSEAMYQRLVRPAGAECPRERTPQRLANSQRIRH